VGLCYLVHELRPLLAEDGASSGPGDTSAKGRVVC
jgi:hypothetical protein